MKFQVGEIAIYQKQPPPAGLEENPMFPFRDGDEVEIIRVGPFPRMESASEGGGLAFSGGDYEISGGPHRGWFCLERNLRKRRPPEEPAEDEFQRDLGRWLKVEQEES